jgi:hypothetical protein
MRLRLAVILTVAAIVGRAQQRTIYTPKMELNTILMNSTFRIWGPSTEQPNKLTAGTGFLIGKTPPDKTLAYTVLVTAKHVLEE